MTFKNKNNQKFYIVTGLPRSGTSLVAGILHNLKIDMISGHAIRKDSRNTMGFFERSQVVNVNAMLTNSKTFIGVVESAEKVSNGYLFDVRSNIYNIVIDDIFVKKGNHIGVKDPRFCYPQLLDIFTNSLLRHIPLENIKVLLTYRDIFSIIDSLASIDDDIPADKPTMIPYLLDIYLSTLKFVIEKQYRFKIVSYERLVADRQKGVQEIADFCDVPIMSQAVSLVDQKLKRF